MLSIFKILVLAGLIQILRYLYKRKQIVVIKQDYLGYSSLHRKMTDIIVKIIVFEIKDFKNGYFLKHDFFFFFPTIKFFENYISMRKLFCQCFNINP